MTMRSRSIPPPSRCITVLPLAALTAVLALTACSEAGVLNPRGPIAEAERLLLINSTAIMLVVVIPVIVATLGFAWWYRASNPRAVRSLEDQGRLVREGSDTDRRMLHLYLTDAGWAVYDEIAIAALAREAEIYSPLSTNELATFRRLLQKLSDKARTMT